MTSLDFVKSGVDPFLIYETKSPVCIWNTKLKRFTNNNDYVVEDIGGCSVVKDYNNLRENNVLVSCLCYTELTPYMVSVINSSNGIAVMNIEGNLYRFEFLDGHKGKDWYKES